MADDTPTTVAGSLGPINPASPLAFMLGGGDLGSLSLEEIKRRRAIALALASRSKGYPKTFGEGLTYLGESLGDRFAEDRLAAAEKTFEKGYTADPLARPIGAAAAPAAVTPPVAAAPATSPENTFGGRPYSPITPVPAPEPRRPLPSGLLDPARIGATDEAIPPEERRNRLAQLLTPEGVAPQNPTAGAPLPAPRGPALASLSPLGTMSDAPPIGTPPIPDENPPTPTDIQPMRQLAQVGAGAALGPGGAAMGPNPVPMPADPRAPAGSPIGTIPGAFDVVPPAIRPSTATGPSTPGRLPPFAKPIAPQKQDTPTEEELRGMALIQKYPGYERAQQQGQALISFGKEKREAAYARQVKEYDADMATYEKRALAWEEAERTKPKTDLELQTALDKRAQEQLAKQQFPLGLEHNLTLAKESFKKVEKLPDAVQAIADIRNVVNSKAGMYTGKFANQKLELAKAGIAMGREDPTAVNTETFRGLVPPLIAALRPTIVGSGQQALPEFEQLQKAAAGDIDLEKGAILNIIAKIEQQAQRAALQHHETLITLSGGNEAVRRDMFGSMRLPLEKFVPPHVLQALVAEVERNKASVPRVRAIMEEFDRDNYTPGLAAKLLVPGRR